MSLTRSEFLRLLAGAGAATLGAAALGACDSSEGKSLDASTTGDAKPVDAKVIDGPPIDAPPAANCMQNGTMVPQIGTNHGHTLLAISAADIVAGVEKSYQLSVGTGHVHAVVVTAAMFTQLRQNMQVTATSDAGNGGGHLHSVTIRCA